MEWEAETNFSDQPPSEDYQVVGIDMGEAEVRIAALNEDQQFIRELRQNLIEHAVEALREQTGS